MKKVVCIGAVNVDIISYVEEFCDDDEEIVIKEVAIRSGGQAGNIADGLGKLGKEAFFLGNIGEDVHTSMLLRDFDKANVNYSFAKRTNKPNNSLYCFVNKKAARRMYIYPHVDLDINDFPEELYEDTKFIVFASLDGENIIDLYTAIASEAKKRGIKIAMDPGNILARHGIEKLRPLLKLCDYITPSLGEVELMVGSLDNVEELYELVPHIIVTCGGRGAKYYKSGKLTEFGVKEISKKFIDSTGAGDCFTAAFVSGLLDGKSEEEAIEYAILAGRIAITEKGARTMPTHEEIEDFQNE